MIKTKLRIVKDNYLGYGVQYWRWYWPFWRQASYTLTFSTLEDAENWARKKFTCQVVKEIQI